jgi:hypothetical protein
MLAAAFLLFSGINSYLAPFGIWRNRIFGLPAWAEQDPGAAYVDAAHQLTWG